jgi:hypothetical protein
VPKVSSRSRLRRRNVVIVGHGNLMRAATGAYANEAGSGIYAPAPVASPAEPASWRGFGAV